MSNTNPEISKFVINSEQKQEPRKQLVLEGIEMVEEPNLNTQQQMLEPPMPQNKQSQGIKHFSQHLTTYINTDEIPINIVRDYYTIDYEKMRLNIKKQHPTNSQGNQHGCCEVCCDVNSGYHTCCGSSKKSDLSKYGVAATLYFKTLKHLIIFFFIFSIFSIPLLYFNIASAKENTTYKFNTYYSYFYATTVGTIGINLCQNVQPLSNQDSSNQEQLYQNQAIFKCPEGSTVNTNVYEIGIIPSNTRSNCNFIDPEDLDKDCNDDDKLLELLEEQCGGKNECEFTLTENHFKSCSKTITNELIYVSMYCTDTSIKLGFDKTIKKKNIALFMSIFDAVIVLCFFLMKISLHFANKKCTYNTLSNSLSASLYTIEIRNLPQNLQKYELQDKLNDWLINKMKQHYPSQFLRIIDIQFAVPIFILEAYHKRGQLVLQKQHNIKKFVTKYKLDNKLPNKAAIVMQHLQKAISTIQDNPDLKKKAVKDYKKIEKIERNIKKVNERLIKTESESKRKYKSAYVTFDTMKSRNQVHKHFNTTQFDRFIKYICGCCTKNDRLFISKDVKVISAPEPQNILWKNFSTGSFQKKIRRFISLIITIILLAISFAIIAKLKVLIDDIRDKNPQVDCDTAYMKQFKIDDFNGNEELEKAFVTEYNGEKELRIGRIECYCSYGMMDKINQEFAISDTEDKKICKQWFIDRTVLLILPVAIAFVVLIVNIILQILFGILSNFERYSNQKSELLSRVIKIFLTQFINTAIIILVINSKMSTPSATPGFFEGIFNGSYKDLNPSWFRNVGTIILITMFINTFAGVFSSLIWGTIRKFKKCWDQSCSCNPRKTKQTTQKRYEALYCGPEFRLDFKYAQILTSIFVCFLYSSGMPILYFIVFLQLIILYWLDKFLLFRVCSLPKNIDNSLQDYFEKILYAIVIIHTLMAIWIYGNENIFNEEMDQDKYYDVDGLNLKDGYLSEFVERITKPESIVLTALIILIIVSYVLIFIFYKPIKKCLSCCVKPMKERISASISNPFSQRPFYSMLNAQQIEDEMNLIRIVLHQDKEFLNQKQIVEYQEKLKELETLQQKQKQEKVQIQSEFQGANGTKAGKQGTPSKKEQDYLVSHMIKKDKNKFQNLHSYDIRLNPIYSELFAINELILESQKFFASLKFNPEEIQQQQ